MPKQRKGSSGIKAVAASFKPLATDFIQKDEKYVQSAHKAGVLMSGVNVRD